ncbi:ROK family protein [Pedosphaera parvula]|uniref:ROK family protein n=1 Tax=Pedosphaera parvula (strain Ellin514) TaxID=320771 RepID=B9XSP6_PEDPL|nr:ROK family protein [Pedosphaera parvula]EEF57131.1 ROK family protein [Pedosphaera parvula Ellin514]
MNKPAALGIDLGGTKTLCVLVDENCRPLKSIKFKTAPEEGCDEFTKNLLNATKSLQKSAEIKKHKLVTIGIGCAGLVDQKKLSIVKSPNLLCLENYPIGKYLQKEHNTEVTIGNDVQAGIYGEFKHGAAVGYKNVLGVFFGTGVGGAAIINGRLYSGSSSMGGQVGGILAQPIGGREAALSHGIVDRIASKASIASEALVMAVKDWAPYLHNKVGTDLAQITWGVLKRAIQHGDHRIEEMLRARMRVVGIALSNIINFLNPDMLVIGGGLAMEMPELVHTELETGLREYLIPEVSEVLKVRLAQLKGDAVALGAASQAWEKWQKHH